MLKIIISKLLIAADQSIHTHTDVPVSLFSWPQVFQGMWLLSLDAARGFREKQAGIIIRTGLNLSAVTITNIPGIRKVTLLFRPFFPP